MTPSADNSEREIVIEIKDLTVGYDENVVLKNLNFKIYKGEIFSILGGSGCGKTTILKHMIGLWQPIKGDVFIKGKSIVQASWDEKRKIMRYFGVLYQTGALFGSLSLGENIALPIEEFTDYEPEKIKEIVHEKLKLVNLDGYENYMPCELSGGMRKRAGLARAFALEPEILFFDEPSSGLDPVTAAKLDELILNFRKTLGTTMVIVTHELDSMFTISDRVIVLDSAEKGVVASGDPYYLREHSPNSHVREFLTRSGLSRKM